MNTGRPARRRGRRPHHAPRSLTTAGREQQQASDDNGERPVARQLPIQPLALAASPSAVLASRPMSEPTATKW